MTHILLATGPKKEGFFRTHRLRIVLLIAMPVLGVALLLRFGGYILISTEAPLAHADVAVMLAGRDSGEEARLAAAMTMLQERRVDYVMLSAGRTYFLGEWFPDLIRRYVEKKYEAELARKVTVCEVNSDVDSTAEEAAALQNCLVARHAHSLIVVTSNYHTRRARMIWERTLAHAGVPIAFSIVGISDGDFEPDRWWRKRRYAKIWFLEGTKLVWSSLFEVH
jgi:uncharacterized SAM-binding protein YcdF (DUF218 family)